VRPEISEHLLDLIASTSEGWSEKQMDLFELLSKLDRKFYCPYFEEGENINDLDEI
jgi:hypothetical protein